MNTHSDSAGSYDRRLVRGDDASFDRMMSEILTRQERKTAQAPPEVSDELHARLDAILAEARQAVGDSQKSPEPESGGSSESIPQGFLRAVPRRPLFDWRIAASLALVAGVLAIRPRSNSSSDFVSQEIAKLYATVGQIDQPRNGTYSSKMFSSFDLMAARGSILHAASPSVGASVPSQEHADLSDLSPLLVRADGAADKIYMTQCSIAENATLLQYYAEAMAKLLSCRSASDAGQADQLSRVTIELRPYKRVGVLLTREATTCSEGDDSGIVRDRHVEWTYDELFRDSEQASNLRAIVTLGIVGSGLTSDERMLAADLIDPTRQCRKTVARETILTLARVTPAQTVRDLLTRLQPGPKEEARAFSVRIPAYVALNGLADFIQQPDRAVVDAFSTER